MNKKRARYAAFRSALGKVARGEDYQRLSGWFEQGRKHMKQEGHRRIEELSGGDGQHPLLGKVSLLAPLSLGLREQAHTSMIAWLLDPSKEHGFGATLLEALLRDLSPDKQNGHPAHVKVESESYLSNGNGRVDIRLTGKWDERRNGPGWLLLIEAKIKAREGKDQLSRYDKDAQGWKKKNRGGQVHKLYLTAAVSDRGQSTRKKSGWEHRNYGQLMKVFWSTASKKSDAEGFHLLRHYLTGVLKDIMDWPIPITKDNVPYETLSLLPSVSSQRSVKGESR